MHPVRKLLSEMTAHRVGTGPIKELNNDALLAEWKHLDNKIQNASGWGAALAAYAEFRKECERELTRRNIPIPTPQDK